jgi:phage baseplate assembly protein W
MSTPIPTVISWPLGGVDETGRLQYARDDKSIREVLLNILLTRPGERIMRPEFGAGLMDFIHQPNNETTRNLIADVVQRAITRWEPRVEVEDVEVATDEINIAEVHIRIRYHLIYTLIPYELSLSLNLGGA